MFVSQISVYLENVKGTLCRVTTLLESNKVDILALAIADTAGFGIVRFIVKEDDIQKTISILQASGYSARTNKVICVKVPNEPGGLNSVLTLMEDAGIAVEYLYSFNYSADGKALLIFRLSDQDAGITVLKQHNIRLVSQEEINALA